MINRHLLVSILILVLLGVGFNAAQPVHIANADPEAPAPIVEDSQGRAGSDATIKVYGVDLPAFHLEWDSHNESDSWSFLDPNGCNLDPTCANNGALLWNGAAKTSQIIVYTADNPNLTCWVCSVVIDHYKYSVDDKFYRSSVDAGGYWITTFSNYP